MEMFRSILDKIEILFYRLLFCIEKFCESLKKEKIMGGDIIKIVLHDYEKDPELGSMRLQYFDYTSMLKAYMSELDNAKSRLNPEMNWRNSFALDEEIKRAKNNMSRVIALIHEINSKMNVLIEYRQEKAHMTRLKERTIHSLLQIRNLGNRPLAGGGPWWTSENKSYLYNTNN